MCVSAVGQLKGIPETLEKINSRLGFFHYVGLLQKAEVKLILHVATTTILLYSNNGDSRNAL